MAITCAQCGLKNPNSAVMCDCGFVLAANVDPSTLAQAARANREVRRSVVKPVGVVVSVLFLLIVLRIVMKVLSH